MKRKTAIKFMMSACCKKMDRNTVTRLFDEGRKIAPNYSNDEILYTFLRSCGRGWMASPHNNSVLPLKLLSSICAKQNEGGI